jgi:hypothetical protein
MVRPARKRPAQHRIRVREDSSDLREQRIWFLAHCSCGWQAPTAKPTTREARDTGDTHLAEVHARQVPSPHAETLAGTIVAVRDIDPNERWFVFLGFTKDRRMVKVLELGTKQNSPDLTGEGKVLTFLEEHVEIILNPFE